MHLQSICPCPHEMTPARILIPAQVPDDADLSMAAAQGFLLLHRDSPIEALVRRVSHWSWNEAGGQSAGSIHPRCLTWEYCRFRAGSGTSCARFQLQGRAGDL